MLMQLYDTFIMPGAAQRRKLTSFVVGKAALEKGCFASLSPHNATLLVTRRCGYRGFSLYLDVHREASVCISTCLRVQAAIGICIGLGFLYDAYRCFYLCVYVCLDAGGHAEDMRPYACNPLRCTLGMRHFARAAKCFTCTLLIGRGKRLTRVLSQRLTRVKQATEASTV